MTNKILSKNNLLSEFNARKLSYFANRIQIFYVNERGSITKTCQSVWNINQNQETNFFEVFENFKLHKEAIDFLFSSKEKDGKSLPISNLEIIFEEETFFVDAIFNKKENVDKNLDKNEENILECLIENKTDYYCSINRLEQDNKLQEVEFLNERWQLTKDNELLEVSHQKELTKLNEQLRVDWTNLLADTLKRTIAQNFIQTDSKNDFKNLLTLSDSFEKISGIRLFPDKLENYIGNFSSDKKTFSYLGDNQIHQKLIHKLVELAGGNFIKSDVETSLKYNFSKVNFIFIEQDFITKDIIKSIIENKEKDDFISSCLLFEPLFLEKKRHLINNKTNLLIYPLYPFQIWQQLLSFTKTNMMSYHEKIDLSQIYEIVDNEPILVQSMLQILDKNLREYPAQLQQEFNEGELDTLRQTIHKFKSCTAYTGLTQFNTTLSEIEASQENGWTIAEIKDKLEFVLQAIPIIKVQVEEKLRELEKEMS